MFRLIEAFATEYEVYVPPSLVTSYGIGVKEDVFGSLIIQISCEGVRSAFIKL